MHNTHYAYKQQYVPKKHAKTHTSYHTSPPLYTYDFWPLLVTLRVVTSHVIASACCNTPWWRLQYIRNNMQTSYHEIHHSKHPHHIPLHRPSRRMTFDPSWLRYALSHHISLHQRVAIRRDDASNTFAITCKHLITKYITRNTPITSHFTAPLDVWLLTPPGYATRCHITFHCISVLQYAVMTPPIHSL